MATLQESAIFEEGIFQLEKSTPPLGGAPVFSGSTPTAGHANAQAQQLANRTRFLKQRTEGLDTYKVLADYNSLRNYSGSATSVIITNSRISGQFNRLLSSSLLDNGGTIIVDSLSRVWLREYQYDVMAEWFDVIPGDSSPAVALSNAQGINKACDFVGNQFPGRVILPRGTIYLTDTNPSAGSWDNKRAIYLRFGGINLGGQGVGRTILKLIDQANCTVIKVGSYVEQTVSVWRCKISDLEIDGSRLTQIEPTPTQDHFAGIAVSNNCQYTELRNLYVRDTQYYGIGLGQDGLSNCRVYNVETNRTGADGLDWKNNSNDQTGGIIDGFKARNFGLLPMSNVLTPQAGLDLRSGVSANNINISSMTGESGLIGIRIQRGTAGEVMAQPSTISNWKVEGSGAADSQGVRVISRGSTVEYGSAKGCDDGVSISNLDCRLSNVVSESNNTGLRLWGSTVEADTLTATGLLIRSNTLAGVVCDSVDEVTFLGADIRNNGVGIDIRAGSSNIRFIGGSCTGNTTQLNDNGTGTVIQHVSGLRTRQRISASVPIDSVGVKNITVNHTLGVTPSVSDVQLQLRRATNVGDWVPGALNITNDPTSTQIFAQLRVVTASATAGATVNVDFDIQSKCTM